MVVGLILSYIAVFIIVGLMIAFLAFTGYIYWNRRKYAHIPCVPMPSFYFGHMKLFNKAIHGEDDLCIDALMFEWYKKTGSLVYCMHVLHVSIVIILEPKALKAIMLDKRNPKPPEFHVFLRNLFGQRLMGRGLLTEPNNEEWHKRRVILNKAFHRRFLKDFMDPFNASTELFLDKLSEKADGKTPISMVEHLNRVTLDVISKVAFDLDLGIIEDENSFFNQTVLIAFEAALEGSSMSSKSWNSSYKEEVRRAIRTIRETGRECLSKRIDEMNSGKEVQEDILTYIIKSSQEVKGDDREKMEVMIDEFILFFFAGQETTANLLSFTVLVLGQHPKILKRLREEVKTVVGDRVNITFDDINRLEYMNLVLKETLRLWGPASGIARKVTYDCNIAGYKIPAGTICQFNGYAMARIEEYFQNAEKFDPERFKREEDMTPHTYFPFSFGPKSCIGQQFAMIEARLVLSKFLQRFKFELVPGQKFTVIQKITLKPKEGCMVYLTAK
ncbi:cholesterol 24-hydroxylase-like [Amphiura filiformis]|uniref:cholesterol 24-hydroxylase-like n=1 Tax=Amphiura filiformis TaxID=82378 RepID=UPI003B22183C